MTHSHHRKLEAPLYLLSERGTDSLVRTVRFVEAAEGSACHLVAALRGLCQLL